MPCKLRTRYIYMSVRERVCYSGWIKPEFSTSGNFDLILHISYFFYFFISFLHPPMTQLTLFNNFCLHEWGEYFTVLVVGTSQLKYYKKKKIDVFCGNLNSADDKLTTEKTHECVWFVLRDQISDLWRCVLAFDTLIQIYINGGEAPF